MKNRIALTLLVAALLAGAAQADGGGASSGIRRIQLSYRVTQPPAARRHVQPRQQHQQPRLGGRPFQPRRQPEAGTRRCGATGATDLGTLGGPNSARRCGR